MNDSSPETAEPNDTSSQKDRRQTSAAAGKIEATQTYEEASVVAGETEIPVGTLTGESFAEQKQATRQRAEGTGKHAALVAAGIFLSRLIGFARQRVFAYYFATSDAADVFTAAFRIPNFLQNLFGEGALSASFIPVYTNLLARHDEREATRVAGAVFTILALVVAVLVLVGVLATPYLIFAIAPGFEGEKRELAVRLVRILFPGAGMLVLSAWCLGILNSHRKFFLSYTAPVIWNAAMIVALIGWGGRHGSLSDAEQFRLAAIAAWGSVAGSALQFVVQLPTVFRLVKNLRPVFDFVSENVKTVVHNFVPVFISRGVVQISAYVDSMLASLLGRSAVAGLGYAQLLYTLPVSLFGMSISAAELPAMSSAIGTEQEIAEQLRKRLDAGLRQIAFFIVPSAMGFLALGDVVTAGLFQTGAFKHDSTVYVWSILAGSAVGLLASTLGRLYSSTYYALRDTRTPLKFAVIRVILTTALGYLFALPLPRLLGIDQTWGAAGLTASAGIAGWVEFTLLRRSLNRRIGQTGLPFSYVAKLWASALIAAVAGRGLTWLVGQRHPIIVAVIVCSAYGLVYFALTTLFGLPEARTVVGRFKRLAKLGR